MNTDQKSRSASCCRRGFLKALTAVLVSCLLPFFGACTYTEKERYMNFLADLDVINRFDLCFDAAKDRKTDFYTLNELEILKQDIASYANPNEEAARANGFLFTAADLLEFGTECVKINDMYNYEMSLNAAKEYYAQANAVMRSIIEGSENV